MICQCKWYSSVPASAPDVLHVLLIPGWVAEYTRQPKYQNTAYCSAQSKIQDIVGCTILTANYRVSSVQCIQSSWCVCNGRSRPISAHLWTRETPVKQGRDGKATHIRDLHRNVALFCATQVCQPKARENKNQKYQLYGPKYLRDLVLFKLVLNI